MNLRNMALLTSLMALVIPAAANSVSLQGFGHLYGETPVPVGGQIGQQFTLDNATVITSIGVGLDNNLGGRWAVSIAGTSWSGSTFPFTLAAGTYDFLITGVACNSPCVGGYAVNLDYYLPAANTEIGGSIGPVVGLFGGGLGFELQGTTVSSPVPEPWTLTLLGIGFLGLTARTYRKALSKTSGQL